MNSAYSQHLYVFFLSLHTRDCKHFLEKIIIEVDICFLFPNFCYPDVEEAKTIAMNKHSGTDPPRPRTVVLGFEELCLKVSRMGGFFCRNHLSAYHHVANCIPCMRGSSPVRVSRWCFGGLKWPNTQKTPLMGCPR